METIEEKIQRRRDKRALLFETHPELIAEFEKYYKNDPEGFLALLKQHRIDAEEFMREHSND